MVQCLANHTNVKDVDKKPGYFFIFVEIRLTRVLSNIMLPFLINHQKIQYSLFSSADFYSLAIGFACI